MMNERERQDLEELRAYYNKIQEAIKEIQQKMNKIDLDRCAKWGTTQLTVGAAAFGAYKDCLKTLLK